MEAVQRLVRSLKSGRSFELPEDPKAAYFMLLSFIMQNQPRTFVELLGTGKNFDVNFFHGKSKRTLLHMAANVGAYECLWHLLKKGALPNVQDRQGITPLQVASRNGFSKCIAKLLEYGADIEIKNNEGMTAIHWLASNGRTEIFSEISKFIKDIDITDFNLQTPLHVACLNGHKSTVLKLLEFHANIEKTNTTGCTPLFFACRHGHAEVAKVLICNGALLTSNSDKQTPLDAAFLAGYGQVCYVILDYKDKEFKLLSGLIQSCLSPNADIKNVEAAFLYIGEQRQDYRDFMLQELASQVRLEGLKLLSPSSDYKLTTERFLKVIKIYNKMLTSESHSENFRMRTHRRTGSDISTSPRKTTLQPQNIASINFETDTLWESLNTWMKILQSELYPSNSYVKSKVVNSKSCLSAPTINESLRLTQPAVQLAINQTPPPMPLSRSDSYHNAMETTDQEILPNSISRSMENISMHRRSSDGSVNRINLSFSQLQTENQCIAQLSPSHMHQHSNMPSTSLGSGNSTANVENKISKEGDVLSITADRLCAVIHGYYLFCQSNPVWNCGKMYQFNKFVETHEKILQLLVSRNTSLIFEHFNFVLVNPMLLQRFLPAIHAQPFVDRQKWFYENLYADKNRISVVYDETAVIHVSRDSLLSASCKQLEEKNESQLKKNISVRFQGEEGMGAGVTREWLDLLIKEIVNPDCALFTLSADGSTFQPNSNSFVNPDHLSYFHFAGRIMGLALYHKHLITAYFTRSFYKHMLGVPASYKDIESIDPEYSKNLQWILDNEISSLGLEIPFSVETDVFGQTQEVELKSNGKNIIVTDLNKCEYVQLAADLRMTKAIKSQIEAFLKGFYQFIPHHLVSLFNEYELELLLSGLPDLDLTDWKNSTVYQAGYSEDSQVIKWFWEVVGSLKKEEQVQLLQFTTGTSRVPWGGFSNLCGPSGNQLFTICCSADSTKMLPTSSTCFNLLKLPEYETKEDLEKMLKIAIACGNVGFEFT
ncbi:E3 ubiquitin-protein ligase HACE1 isoform X3 [Hydra vulgaris]